MASSRSSRASSAQGAPVIDRLRALARLRVRGRAAAAGASFLALFALCLAVFLVSPEARVRRVIFFPSTGSRAASGKPARLVAEQRFLPRHRDADRDVRELVEAVLLGPARHGEAPLFPPATTVRTLMVRRGVTHAGDGIEGARAHILVGILQASRHGIKRRQRAQPAERTDHSRADLWVRVVQVLPQRLYQRGIGNLPQRARRPLAHGRR